MFSQHYLEKLLRFATIVSTWDFLALTPANHILFLTICLLELKSCDLCDFTCSLCENDVKIMAKYITTKNPSGGMIGPGNSIRLHNLLQWSDILLLHACFHDAHGFLFSHFGSGRGYAYVFPTNKFFIMFRTKCCLIGHATGCALWIVVWIIMKNVFRQLVTYLRSSNR